jgi:hypothetical protein
MSALVTNNASATLANNTSGAGGTGVSSTATSITLTTGEGSLFPSPSSPNFFYATLVNTSNAIEVIKCTARSGDTLTVVRGQDNTAALSWNNGDKCELRPCAGLFNNKLDLDTGGTLGSTSQAGAFGINGPGGTARYVTAYTAGNASWSWGADNTALGSQGSDVGSNFALTRYNDNGVAIDSPIYITRSTGAITVKDSLTVDGTTFFNGSTSFSAYTNGSTPLIQFGSNVWVGWNGTNIYLTNGGSSQAYLNTSGTFFAPAITASSGAIAAAAGLTVSSGGATISGLVTAENGITVSNGLTVASGTLTIDSGVTVSTSSGAIPFASLAAPSKNTQATNGYVQLPGGTIIQWGYYSGSLVNGNTYTITFTTPFPTGCWNVVTTVDVTNTPGSTAYAAPTSSAPSYQGVNIRMQGYNSGSSGNVPGVYWMAIGY